MPSVTQTKKKERSIRDYLELDEIQDFEADKITERLHTFLIRFIQLNSDLAGEDINFIRSLLESQLESNKIYYPIYCQRIIRKNLHF
ncbi:hypothetical protein [Acidiplasma cupricumulans]|uniref:hypothetical protein n=1 Tax=Acidiplasma cupricumulans TaxID=312540 RepID=UPI0007861583|nr:hypothetical protein [Acidiplasma cupricumulans]